GSQLVIGGLLGVFAFHEWTKQIQFIIGFIAMAVLVVGFYFSAKRDPENAVVEEGRNYTKGLTALTYSTLGYVLYVILFNNLAVLWFNVHFDTLTIILPMSVGMIFGALVMGRFKIK
ncbi:GRP family sugar transporter, partial [Leuconostoc mesenteroides]